MQNSPQPASEDLTGLGGSSRGKVRSLGRSADAPTAAAAAAAHFAVARPTSADLLQMARALGKALRETGQALDRLGRTLQGNFAFREERECAAGQRPAGAWRRDSAGPTRCGH